MKKYLILLAALTGSIAASAQNSSTADSLLNSMSAGNSVNEPVAIFKSSRMVLTQSSETVKGKNLNFLVIHRFGDFAGKQGGGQTYFGLDAVNDVYLGFEYGLSDNFNIDIGRSTIGGLADLELKYALLHQTANGSSPLAITLIGESGVRPYGNSFTDVSSRMSYFAQAIFARKFSSSLSLQVAPSYVRNNTPMPVGNEQDFMALSGTARVKVSRHMGVVIDYAHSFSAFARNRADFSDPLGVGLEIETGGHVFTMNVTNARAINEINYLSNGQNTAYGSGQYRLGFTISRMFDFNSHKKHNKEE
jgi:hypothetical protein